MNGKKKKESREGRLHPGTWARGPLFLFFVRTTIVTIVIPSLLSSHPSIHPSAHPFIPPAHPVSQDASIIPSSASQEDRNSPVRPMMEGRKKRKKKCEKRATCLSRDPTKDRFLPCWKIFPFIRCCISRISSVHEKFFLFCFFLLFFSFPSIFRSSRRFDASLRPVLRSGRVEEVFIQVPRFRLAHRCCRLPSFLSFSNFPSSHFSF